jgi:hypothetical protein
MGSSRSGSVFLTLPTRGLTGQHVVSFDGQGSYSPKLVTA